MTYSVIRHSEESPDDEVIVDEGVEIIEAPYPEKGKAQVPKRCFIYDDADGYPEGYEGYIEHHGILGMKWGIRRYQNADGSLTDAGRKRYGVEAAKQKVENADGIREKKKVAATEIAKSATGAGASFAGLAAGQWAFEVAPSIAGSIVTLERTIAGTLPNATFTAREAAFLLSRMGVMKVIAPALATPVGQIAAVGAMAAGAGLTAYNIYKGVKMAKVAAELNSEANHILDEATKKSETKDKKNDILSEKNIRKPEYKDRADSAAELGIRALNKMGNDGGDPKNKDRKEWFLYEDQTIGLPAIADMVRSGYTKNEIKKAIANADSNSELYGVSDNNGNLRPSIEKYLDTCIDIVNEDKNK